MLDHLFKLDAHRTSVGRELQAGLTTFAAMACGIAAVSFLSFFRLFPFRG